jgi:hypothetical protein
MNINLESMALEMPHVASHPNRVPFHGVLTFVDTPSDKPPSGARGHRVTLTRAATEEALPSLLGMAIDYAPSLDRHDARRKIGVITSAEIANDASARVASANVETGLCPVEVTVQGFLYAKDFPEIVKELRAGGRTVHGMSYEIADAHVADLNASVWEVTQFTFTGAALLRRDKAAYRSTWIELAAGAEASTC